MKTLYKILFALTFLVLILWAGHFWYHNKILGFSIVKISSNLTYNPAWKIQEPSRQELEQIFSQPYFYLKSGTQSYAFVSRDGKYILKFFKFKHLKPHFWDRIRPEKVRKKQRNLEQLFSAYKLAYDAMKEDAGLIYIHLNKTSHLKKKIQVADKHQRVFWIDLDQTEFCIQEKAELIFHRFDTLLKNHKHHALCLAIQEMKNLIERRSQKGLSDDDHGVTNNFGFVGDRAIQIDIGRIHRAKESDDYERISKRMDQWLQDAYSQ